MPKIQDIATIKTSKNVGRNEPYSIFTAELAKLKAAEDMSEQEKIFLLEQTAADMEEFYHK